METRFVHASENFVLNAARIIAIGDVSLYQMREALKQERKNGTLLNACGARKAKTAIILDNGTLCASPRTINIILRELSSLNSKGVSTRGKMVNRKYTFVDEPENVEEDHDSIDEGVDLDIDIPFDECEESENEDVDDE